MVLSAASRNDGTVTEIYFWPQVSKYQGRENRRVDFFDGRAGMKIRLTLLDCLT